MSPVSPYNNLYLDQYFPAEEPVPERSISSDFGDYASFDEDFEIVQDIQADASDFEVQGEDYFEEEALPELTAKQKSTIEWLEDRGEDLEKDFSKVQDRFAALESGDASPEEKRKRLEEIESELRGIERELNQYKSKEESLLESVTEEQLVDFDAPIESKELEKELENLKETIEGDLEVAKTEEAEAVEAELKAEEKEKKGRELKENLTDALGYLNGSKDVLYFTANVWGDKHIKDYHEDVTTYASEILRKMADAALSGDWSEATSAIQALSNGASDNTLGLVGCILSKHYPQILDDIPSQVLEAMSDAIRKGNSPGDKNIYYIPQGGKYDRPKDDRRRKDMGHVDFSYSDAADLLSARATTNRAREKEEAESSPADHE